MLEFLKKVPVLNGACHYIKKGFLSMWVPACRTMSKHLDPPSEGIVRYKGSHKGERCFIVATGPSLTIDDLAKIKSEYTFSMNSIVNMYDKTDFRPTYYLLQDGNVERRIRDALKNIDHSNAFIGTGNAYGFKVNLNKKTYKEFYQDCVRYNLDSAYHMMDMCYSSDGSINTEFSDDFAKKAYDGCTVTYSAIQLAIYMGFSKIYLLGCDTNFAGHIDDKEKVVSPDAGTPAYAMIEAYKVAKQYADEHGVKIYNATRGGMLEVFPRVDFDTLFPEKFLDE